MSDDRRDARVCQPMRKRVNPENGRGLRGHLYPAATTVIPSLPHLPVEEMRISPRNCRRLPRHVGAIMYGLIRWVIETASTRKFLRTPMLPKTPIKIEKRGNRLLNLVWFNRPHRPWESTNAKSMADGKEEKLGSRIEIEILKEPQQLINEARG